jgi:RNA polymerase sigma factor (sigma-70 family)
MNVETAVDGLKQGCRSSWENLYSAYRRDMVRLANSLLKDWPEAEDVVQQVFARLPRSIQTYDPSRGAFKDWLCASVSNLAKNRLLDLQRRQEAHVFCHNKHAADKKAQQTAAARVADAISPENAVIVREFLAGEPPQKLKKRYPRKTYFKAMSRLKKELAG